MKLNLFSTKPKLTKLLAKISEEFLSELVRVYNVLYDAGRVDDVIVNTIIFPIHKKGDRNQPSNYRAISFMNVAAKILMGIINDRLYRWVENNNILNEYQAGFRKGYSTSNNIFNLAAIVHLKFEGLCFFCRL